MATSLLSIEGTRDWMWLPDFILESVLSNLISLDYVRFSCVCKRWHSIATDQLPRHNATFHKRVPFHLILPTNGNDELWSLYSITQEKLLEFKLQIPKFGRPCGSSRGWLAFWGEGIRDHRGVTLFSPFSDDRDHHCHVTLFNPFTRAQITLPPLITARVDRYDFVKDVINVSLSADPCDNCIVIASVITSRWRSDTLAIRPGRDEKWTRISPRIDPATNGELGRTALDEMTFDQSGKWVYAATGECGMFVRANIENIEKYFSSDRPTVGWEVGMLDRSRHSDLRTASEYLVKGSNGDVLIVLWQDREPNSVHVPKVFKIQGLRVVEADDMNGDAVFLGLHAQGLDFGFSNFSFSTAVAARDFQGIEANCVYNWGRFPPYEIRKFDVTRKEVCSHRPASKRSGITILPTINLK